MHLPYVVSGDIQLLLSRWAQVAGFTLPAQSFFDDLRAAQTRTLTRLFPGFEFISESAMSLNSNNLPAAAPFRSSAWKTRIWSPHIDLK